MKNSIIWRPIFLEEVLKTQLDKISEILYQSQSESDISLYIGNSGVALFLYYLWILSKNKKYYDRASKLLLDNFDSLNNNKNVPYSLCSGSTGFMWLINHLVSNNFIKGDCNELFMGKDIHINKLMLLDIKEGKYDFMHSSLGTGLYFINRANLQSIKFVESLIIELERISEKDANGIKWRSLMLIPSSGTFQETFNIGMSHGMSSIIVFLCKAFSLGVLREKTKGLIEGAVNYLVSLKSGTGDTENGSFFPSSIPIDNNNISYNSRLGWCYGDLGVCIALWHASQVLSKKEWAEISIKILLKSTARKNALKEYVRDAGICHGSVGIAQIYNRMFQTTGIIEFRDAAIYWINDSLKKAIFPDGLAGYKTFTETEMVKDKGLLTGIAGIGLVYISAISNIEPKWDNCFLLS